MCGRFWLWGFYLHCHPPVETFRFVHAVFLRGTNCLRPREAVVAWHTCRAMAYLLQGPSTTENKTTTLRTHSLSEYSRRAATLTVSMGDGILEWPPATNTNPASVVDVLAASRYANKRGIAWSRQAVPHGHGHGHGLFILATYHPDWEALPSCTNMTLSTLARCKVCKPGNWHCRVTPRLWKGVLGF